MSRGGRYRILSATGVVILTTLAVLIANHRVAQSLLTTYIPLFNRLPITVLSGETLLVAVILTVGTTTIILAPLYKPRPRRTADTVAITQRRVAVAGLALATVGYFDWTYRLPRTTLVMLIGILLLLMPLWFVIFARPPDEPDRALIIGDDIEQIERIYQETSLPFVGYLCPTSVIEDAHGPMRTSRVTDGGSEIGGIDRLGGLSRLETVLVDNDIDTVVLAFDQADRGDFFGALDVCHQHGVAAKVHRDYATNVLVSRVSTGTLVDIEVVPLDVQDYVLKRSFDIVFSLVGLLVFLPLFAVIAVLIKLDSNGPVLYSQRRTSGLGGTLRVHKFRTMYPADASPEPVADKENDRITRIGRILRPTHLDELPQLWLILIGKMSVVGPRPVWTDEESLLEAETDAWRKRWFVKPGLTGLAQVRGAGSTDPELKLRSDLEYIRRQNFRLDMRIVVQQVWLVVADIIEYLR